MRLRVGGGEHRRWLLGWVASHVAGHRDRHPVMPKHLVIPLFGWRMLTSEQCPSRMHVS
jgi:hypothetical protein